MKALIANVTGGVLVALLLIRGLLIGGLPDNQRETPWYIWAIMAGVIVAACILVSLALTAKDEVKERIHQGQRVNLLLRLYLASGLVSLVLWIGTSVVLTWFLATYLPV